MSQGINPAVALMDESLIRDMTRVAEETGAVNLAQGFPDMPVPAPVLEAAHRALDRGHNAYTRTWGAPKLRRELSAFLERRDGLLYDPETELVITCGASEAIMASLLALLAPGDTAVVPEPIYENYLPGIRLAGARPAILPIDPFDGSWDPEVLQRALGDGARALILNTPANPTGKVWTAAELQTLADHLLASRAWLITDETYAFLTLEGRHVAPATLPGLRERTVTIASFSKTYAVTGWRVGFAAAPAPLMGAIRKVHDFLTVCAPAPSQTALVEALRLPDSYYEGVREAYAARRALLSEGLESAGWRVNRPQGTYFLLVDLRDLGIPDDRKWALDLARSRGVAGVPGSAFLWRGMPQPVGTAPDRRGTFLRLSFGKREEQLAEAVRRLAAGPRLDQRGSPA